MCTPSMTSRCASNPLPVGQMIETPQPAARNVVASIHTRLSKGRGRFSTTIRTLPGNTIVPGKVDRRWEEPREVDDRLGVPAPQERLAKLPIRICYDEHVGPVKKPLELVGQQCLEVRQVLPDVCEVGAHEQCLVDVG